jgi:hypothetical protein
LRHRSLPVEQFYQFWMDRKPWSLLPLAVTSLPKNSDNIALHRESLVNAISCVIISYSPSAVNESSVSCH